MAQPNFIQKKDGSNANATSLTLAPGTATTAGNTLLVGVLLNANGAQTPASVAGIADSAGDVMAGMTDTGVPVNTWSLLGTNTQDGIRLEWWVSKGAVSITDLVISLTYAQSVEAVVLEFNSANGITKPIFQALQANQNTITGNLLHHTVSTFPNSGSELMIGLFAALGDAFNTTPLEGTALSTGSLSIPPALSYQVVENGTVDSTGLLNLNAVSASLFATQANVQASSMQCFYLLISGGLVLNTPPGFSDQPDSTLAAGKYALGIQLAKISGNAALGMCRMEFFQGVYTHGETVDLPVSPVDGYAYQASELTYLWVVYSSCNPSNAWITGPTALWYAQWNVDQTTGLVTSEEWYRNDASSAVSNDGYLQVFTIAQRQKSALTVAELPTFTEMTAGVFQSDLPYSTDLLTALNNNSKFSVVGQECISMGEFYNGQTVPLPVSLADGYEYTADEVIFLHSWRWTCSQTQYTAPPWYTDWSFDGCYASVSSSGVVTCEVVWGGRGGEGSSVSTSDGRLAVFAMCQRKPRFYVSGNNIPWNYVSGGQNAAFSFVGFTEGVNQPVVIPASAGHIYSLTYVRGTLPTSTGPVTPASTEATISGSPLSSSPGCCGVGCFADAAGNIVGAPFTFGLTTSLTVPAGAVRIQLGVNTDDFAATDGSYWTMSISRYSASVANRFAEIDNTLFYPGSDLPAALGLQIFQNIQEASLSPEFFGPTDYGAGATIPVPTSPIDGYVYKRAELTYFWTWKWASTWGTASDLPSPGPSQSENARIALFGGAINQSTGVITTNFWRLQPGGPYTNDTTTGVLTVWVVGFRSSQQTSVTVPVTSNPPSDSGSQGDGTPTGWTVNGV